MIFSIKLFDFFFIVDQLNAIFDVIQQFDKKDQPNIVAPKILNEADEKSKECSALFDSYDFGAGFDWSEMFRMVQAMDNVENLDWSREMSVLLAMEEASNQSTPLDAAKEEGDESIDWPQEYY